MTANVPAVVVGWEEDGLRVRLIEPFGKFDVDAEVSARPAVAKRGDSDVTIQKKRQGLRLGGVVVLLKATEGENGLEWRGLDTLKEKADQSEVRVFRRTPVTIFPRPRSSSSSIVRRSCSYPPRCPSRASRPASRPSSMPWRRVASTGGAAS